MADEPASDVPPPEQGRTVPAPRGSWLSMNRNTAMAVGCAVLCGVIAIDIYFMQRSASEHAPPVAGVVPVGAASSSAAPNAAALPASAPAQPSASSDPAAADAGDGAEADPAEAADFESGNGESGVNKALPKHYKTVNQAAVESCTTASVAGLSRQIIAQARCLKPSSFAPLPARPNLTVASEVFPYLQLEARNQLAKALDARPKQKMTINSALRTVAQQYLVWRWSATRRCGVPLATPPGESNHELGIALDIVEAGAWRPILEKQNFKWLGASDRVHFDYLAPAGSTSSSMDVLAFQNLWNRNHPTDKIAEDGRYTPAVEKRLKRAPPDGFPLGASCGKSSAKN